MSDQIAKHIVERDGKYCVTSKDGMRQFGCYTDRGRAERRLAQVEHFAKDTFGTGDITGPSGGGLASPEQGVPRRIRRAVEPPYSATVDIYEGDELVVRHVMFGETAAAAEGLIKTHAKYDAFLDAALKGKLLNGVSPRAVIRKYERLVRGLVLPETGQVAIALVLPPDLQQRLAVQGGEPAQKLHLTLGYYGRVEELRPDALARLVQVLEDTARGYLGPELLGRVSGTGRFRASPSSEGREVFYLSFDCPDLAEMRVRLARESMLAEVPLRMAHGFDPHVTLSYVAPGDPDPAVPALPDDLIGFAGLTLMVDQFRYFFPFAANPSDPAAYAVEKGQAGSESRLKAAYMAHVQGAGFEPGRGRDVEAEDLSTDGVELYRVTDGWGEWYFGKDMRWLAQKMADVRAYATCPELDKVFTQRFVKDLGWGNAGWDDALLNALAPVVQKSIQVMKADAQQRYTLGVAYPCKEVDAHKDSMSAEELEKAAWSALARGLQLGLMHQRGTDGAGQVVESYIYRGPRWEIEGQVIESGDWLVGAIWREDVWKRIQAGELTGYSLQGWAARRES